MGTTEGVWWARHERCCGHDTSDVVGSLGGGSLGGGCCLKTAGKTSYLYSMVSRAC